LEKPGSQSNQLVETVEGRTYKENLCAWRAIRQDKKMQKALHPEILLRIALN
jgi:hypothetical protein